MPWVFKRHRNRHSPRPRGPITNAPICSGIQFLHRPVHCKRTGFGFIYGNFRPRWTCPVCNQHHFR